MEFDSSIFIKIGQALLQDLQESPKQNIKKILNGIDLLVLILDLYETEPEINNYVV